MINPCMREALTTACQSVGHKVYTTKVKPTKNKPNKLLRSKNVPSVRSDTLSRSPAGVRLVPYRELRNNYLFRFIDSQGMRVYLKVGEAYSVDQRTDKDSIFLPTDMVEPLYHAV